MKEMVRLGVVLLVFCAISAASLAVTNDLTAPAIENARKEADLENMQEVFKEADEFLLIEEEKLAELKTTSPELSELYYALNSEDQLGYVAKVTTGGFGGSMEIIVGFNGEGLISGLRVGQHAETPGLGDNATSPEFYEQFVGLTLTEAIGVNKVQAEENEILAISAATITSDAVVSGVNGLSAILGGLE